MTDKAAPEVPESDFGKFYIERVSNPKPQCLCSVCKPRPERKQSEDGGTGQELEDEKPFSVTACSIYSNAPSSPLMERLREFEGLLIKRRKRRSSEKRGEEKEDKKKGGLLGSKRGEEDKQKEGQGQEKPDDVLELEQDSDEDSGESYSEYYDSSNERP